MSVLASLLGALVFMRYEVVLGEREGVPGAKVLLAASINLSPCFRREPEYHSRKKRPYGESHDPSWL